MVEGKVLFVAVVWLQQSQSHVKKNCQDMHISVIHDRKVDKRVTL